MAFSMFKEKITKNNQNVRTNDIPDKVIIYRGELEYISRCILDYPNIETGGNLFGFWTPFGIPVIQYVVGTGNNAIHNYTSFIQDYDFFDRNADCLIQEHALHHIGTWHSHHQLSIDVPSGGDANSVFDVIRQYALKSFLLVIGNYYRGETTANVYRFFAEQNNYQHCRWIILEGESPIRQQFDKAHPNLIHIPNAKIARLCPIQSAKLIENNSVTPKVFYPEGYWLNDNSGMIEFKGILEYLKSAYKKVSILQLEDKTVKITVKDTNSFDIEFPLNFPGNPPVIHYNGNILYNSAPKWELSESVSKSVINYIKSISL
ncbi:MAG: hypothetical protein LBS55_05315 [Prevotellaceae bacterium]|jgi:hypothetical protein|nr:hypothetical protein [Prevotellaceae bacterium]